MSAEVMVEGRFGPRGVLPESMWTGLTRPGLTMPSWQAPLRRTSEGLLTSESGAWLPMPEHSEQDLKTLINATGTTETARIAEEEPVTDSMHWLSEISLNAAGCWVGDLDEQALPYITFLDTSRQVLEKPKDVPFTRMCDTTGCFYHRHYDLTLDVPSRRRDLLYPNLDHFAAINGNVVTSWGDVLPSVSESTQELREFQHKSMIYTKRDESLLTLGGISQISVIPGTGCWFTRSYYMTPTGVEGYDNWQYDGYSRLKIPSGLVEKYNYGDYAMLGHRVVWALTGHRLPSTNRIVLNHMCGFRPCTNPGHIEIVHAQTNMLHRTMMRTAKNMLAGEMPIDQGVRELKTKALLRPNSDPNTVDEFWDKKAA